MKTSRFFLSATLFAFAACVSASQARANVITVNDPSFESGAGSGLANGCGTGCSFSSGAIPGWINTNSTGGQFQPGGAGTPPYFNYLPDGPTIAYNTGPYAISQTVGAKVVDGVTYILTVDVGYRSDSATFNPDLGLFIGGVLYNATGTAPAIGDWAVYTTTFTGTSATAGDTITIELFDDGGQGDFDDVALVNNSSVPEPSSGSLMALGLGCCVLASQWRKLRLVS